MRHFISEVWEMLKVEGIIFILFLAACFTHNMDNGSFVYVGLIAILLVKFIFFKQKKLDGMATGLVFFGLFYIIFSPKFIFATAIRLLLGPALFYLYGRYIVVKVNYNANLVIKIVFLMIVCMSFPVWWAVVSNMLSGNIVSTTSIDGYRWLTTWGQSHLSAATTYGIIASFGLCGFGFFLISKTRLEKMDSWMFFICSILSLLITTYLINRTGLVLLVVTTILAILYSVKKVSFQSVVSLFILAIIAVLFLDNWGGSGIIADAYSERETIAGGGNRTWRWTDAVTKLFTRPFGWSDDYYEAYYVHNMWLDIDRVAGIIPFLIMVMATIKVIKTNMALFKSKNNELSILLVTLFSSVFLSYMVEPIIESNIFYLMIFTWIWGLEMEVLNGQKYKKCYKESSLSIYRK